MTNNQIEGLFNENLVNSSRVEKLKAAYSFSKKIKEKNLNNSFSQQNCMKIKKEIFLNCNSIDNGSTSNSQSNGEIFSKLNPSIFSDKTRFKLNQVLKVSINLEDMHNRISSQFSKSLT